MTVDGVMDINGTGFKPGYVIPGRGYLVIGQDQDKMADPNSFELMQSFNGTLSGLHVWSYVLSQAEIVRMSKGCNMGIGNVLMWSDFLISRHGDVVVKCPSRCEI